MSKDLKRWLFFNSFCFLKIFLNRNFWLKEIFEVCKSKSGSFQKSNKNQFISTAELSLTLMNKYFVSVRSAKISFCLQLMKLFFDLFYLDLSSWLPFNNKEQILFLEIRYCNRVILGARLWISLNHKIHVIISEVAYFHESLKWSWWFRTFCVLWNEVLVSKANKDEDESFLVTLICVKAF